MIPRGGGGSPAAAADPPRAASTAAYGLSRPYLRRPAVEAAIRALPADPAALIGVLTGTEPPEVLVHGIRRLHAVGEGAAACRIATALITRTQHLLGGLAAQATSDPAARADLVQDVWLALWQALIAPAPATEFWEVHFVWMLRRRCADAARIARHRQQHERLWRVRRTAAGVDWAELDSVAAPAADLDPDAPALLHAALAQLEGRPRHAFGLRLQGYPTYRPDPAVPTISRALGVGQRAARLDLAAARATLAAWWTQQSGPTA